MTSIDGRAEQTLLEAVWHLDTEMVMRNNPEDRLIEPLAVQFAVEPDARAAISSAVVNDQIDSEALLALFDDSILASSQPYLKRTDRLAAAAHHRAFAA